MSTQYNLRSLKRSAGDAEILGSSVSSSKRQKVNSPVQRPAPKTGPTKRKNTKRPAKGRNDGKRTGVAEQHDIPNDQQVQQSIAGPSVHPQTDAGRSAAVGEEDRNTEVQPNQGEGAGINPGVLREPLDEGEEDEDYELVRERYISQAKGFLNQMIVFYGVLRQHGWRSQETNYEVSEKLQRLMTELCKAIQAPEVTTNPWLDKVPIQWFVEMESLIPLWTEVGDLRGQLNACIQRYHQAEQAFETALSEQAEALTKDIGDRTFRPNGGESDDDVDEAQGRLDSDGKERRRMQRRLESAEEVAREVSQWAFQAGETALIKSGLLRRIDVEDDNHAEENQIVSNRAINSRPSGRPEQRQDEVERSVRAPINPEQRGGHEESEDGNVTRHQQYDADGRVPRSVEDQHHTHRLDDLHNAEEALGEATAHIERFREQYNKRLAQFLQARNNGECEGTQEEWDLMQLTDHRALIDAAEVAELHFNKAKAAAKQVGAIRPKYMTSEFGDLEDDGYDDQSESDENRTRYDLVWELRKGHIERWLQDPELEAIEPESEWRPSDSQEDPDSLPLAGDPGKLDFDDEAFGTKRRYIDQQKHKQEELRMARNEAAFTMKRRAREDEEGIEEQNDRPAKRRRGSF
jgi:hypothetical protein